jgi:hypothetical protein
MKREFSFVTDENLVLKQKVKDFENILQAKNKQIQISDTKMEKEKKKVEELTSIYSKFINL